MKHLRKHFLLFLFFGATLFLLQGLTSPPAVMEEKTNTGISVHVEEIEMPAFRAIGIYGAVPHYKNLKAATEAAFKRLGKYLKKNKLKPSDPFLTIYFSGPETGSVRFMNGVPSAHEIKDSTSPVQPHTVQGGCYLRATHVGPYDELEKTNAQIKAYLETNSLSMGGPVWHEYAVGRHIYADSTKWVTHVYYPVIKENCGK